MMPFLPPLLLARGLTPADLGTVLAAGSALKLLAGPLLGRVADWLGDPRLVLICCTSAAAVFAAGFGLAVGFWALLLVNLALAVALAPTTALADSMALRAAREPPGFDYGRARAAGSASYILAAVLAGALVGVLGAPALLQDPRFGSFPLRAQNKTALLPMLRGIFLTRPAAEWVAALHAAGILASRVNSVLEWLEDGHVQASAAAPCVEQPGLGSLPLANPPGLDIQLGPAPALGEHSDEILREMGG
jgi:MFS family permease